MAIESKEIIIICPVCEGEGEMVQRVVVEGGVPVSQMIDCPKCEGVGSYAWGNLDFNMSTQLEDAVDKLNDILDKCTDIKAVVDEL